MWISQNRSTSGVAHLNGTSLRLGHATSEWSGRKRVLGGIGGVEAAAVVAPVVPDTSPRDVERLLRYGIFQKRCKPAASHVRGTGQDLRRGWP